MNPRTPLFAWLLFLLGHRGSILTIASRSGAWAVGIVLVLLTAIARNYDQTWIGEDPVKWTVGNLGFSLVSGSFLFLVLCASLPLGRTDPPGPSFGRTWGQFLGLFWATAPIAWLYALPVERFLDSLAAAQANVTLLAVVSLWRVLLMARVIQVLHNPPFWGALSITLVAACIETGVVFLFGEGFSKKLMAGMGGLRNSPEENILLNALSTAFTGAFFLFLPAVSGAIACRARTRTRPITPGPEPAPGPLPWPALALAAIAWIAIALPAQRQVARNAELDRLVADARFRDALDHLARHGAKAYAPARVLPPRAFENAAFKELGALFSVLRSTDPAWIHEHLRTRLAQVASHFDYEPALGSPHPAVSEQHLGWRASMSLRQGSIGDWSGVFDGLERSEAGRAWLTNNRAFFELILEAHEPSSGAETHPPAPTNSPADLLRQRLERFPAPR